MSGTFPWYIARAAGLVSWALLAAATLWGLALSTKVMGKRPRANWLLDMHRWLGGTALAFTGVHVGAVLADQYTHFGLGDILVPFAAQLAPRGGGVGRRRRLSPARGRAHVAGACAALEAGVAPGAHGELRAVRDGDDPRAHRRHRRQVGDSPPHGARRRYRLRRAHCAPCLRRGARTPSEPGAESCWRSGARCW